MSSSVWTRFTTALEAKGITFEQVQFASSRHTVIGAAGFTDPLSVAILETEWRKRIDPEHRAESGLGTADASAAVTSSDTRQTVPPHTLLQDYKQLHTLPEEMQDAVVTNEVLNAALGFSGSLIQRGKDGFTVSPLVPLSMHSLCQTVLPVADAVLVLQSVERAEYMGRSLVTMALGETISEICTSYAHQIAKLQRWSRGRPTPLMGAVSEVLRVGHVIVRLRQVLPVDLLLSNCVTVSSSGAGGGAEVTTSLSGPRVLNHLCDQAERYAGSQGDHDMLLLLLRRAVVPYLRMLHRWMHEGVVEDPYGEFFITEAYEPGLLAGGLGGGFGGTTAAHRRNVSRIFLEEMGENVYYGQSSQSAGQQEVSAFERRFSLNKLMVPSFLEKPTRIAKMIFFTGKYCCLLREHSETLPHFGESSEGMLMWSGVDALHRRIQESYEIASGAVIQLLFGSTVDLLGHLNSLKNYYLQSRGDWVVDFLDSAEELVEKSPDRVKIHSVRVLLQAAIARSCAADPYHHLIGCTFSDVSLEQYVHRTPGAPLGSATTAVVETSRCIELLQLEADLQWPVTLVLEGVVLRRFNAIFRLLTWMKVCERNLCVLWHTNEVLAGFSAAYGIKHQLIQFFRQFQFYAAHFVIEPLWGRLMTRIGQSDSVFTINQSLQDFFEGVEMGLVLSSTHRFRSLTKILDLSARFCDIGRHSSTATMPLIEATLHALEDELLDALSELASPVGSDYPQLVPLLTWIDFSGFYDRNNVYHVQHGAAATR